MGWEHMASHGWPIPKSFDHKLFASSCSPQATTAFQVVQGSFTVAQLQIDMDPIWLHISLTGALKMRSATQFPFKFKQNTRQAYLPHDESGKLLGNTPAWSPRQDWRDIFPAEKIWLFDDFCTCNEMKKQEQNPEAAPGLVSASFQAFALLNFWILWSLTDSLHSTKFYSPWWPSASFFAFQTNFMHRSNCKAYGASRRRVLFDLRVSATDQKYWPAFNIHLKTALRLILPSRNPLGICAICNRFVVLHTASLDQWPNGGSVSKRYFFIYCFKDWMGNVLNEASHCMYLWQGTGRGSRAIWISWWWLLPPRSWGLEGWLDTCCCHEIVPCSRISDFIKRATAS